MYDTDSFPIGTPTCNGAFNYKLRRKLKFQFDCDLNGFNKIKSFELESEILKEKKIEFELILKPSMLQSHCKVLSLINQLS